MGLRCAPWVQRLKTRPYPSLGLRSRELIDAVTGAHLWADRFERDLTDVFALQDEVTLAVVSAIEPKMLQSEIELATRRRPENLTAYDFYLRAMPQYYLTTREGFAEAIRLAHRALELDPRFGSAAALAGLCHVQNVVLGYSNDPQFDSKEAVRLVRLANRPGRTIKRKPADILSQKQGCLNSPVRRRGSECWIIGEDRK